jgi:CelD/BcsL family acetyltransferase involved in cellulose biosynthesis
MELPPFAARIMAEQRQTKLEGDAVIAYERGIGLTEKQCRGNKIAPAHAAVAQGTGSMISVTICSPDLNIASPWEDLIRRASSNVFMNPVALRAACDTGFARVHMLLAWEEGAEPKKLVGVWALRQRKIAPWWPQLLEALPYNYAFLSSPVVDPAFVAQVIPAFFAAIEQNTALPNVLSLKDLDAESPSHAAMIKALAERGGAQFKLSESARPFATRELGVKGRGSTRKKLRQDWNRLCALGSVDVVNDRAPGAITQAFEAFLALEAASWKGAQGTALLCDGADAAFVRRLVGDLAQRQNASVALLRLDGRAIAAQVLMYCGPTAYTWKTAFDAEYAKYSPGALLVDKITEELFAAPGIEAIDSCSVEGSFMAQLWAGRRTMVDLLVDVGATQSLGFTLEVGRQRGYHRLRELRNRLRAWSWLPQPKKVGMAASP